MTYGSVPYAPGTGHSPGDRRMVVVDNGQHQRNLAAVGNAWDAMGCLGKTFCVGVIATGISGVTWSNASNDDMKSVAITCFVLSLIVTCGAGCTGCFLWSKKNL